jgi:hypothetical protein
MAKFDPTKDYYESLGVREDATPDEIDRVFRSRARESHPDAGGSEEAMKSLNEAHDILTDPATRKAYDAERASLRPSFIPQGMPHGSSAVFDPEAASRAGTLKIPVSKGDFIGLCMGAAACLGLGLPFLLLLEMQWMFFLWPLRLMTVGVLVIGVLMGHAALRVKQKQMKESSKKKVQGRVILHEIAFWAAAAILAAVVSFLLYAH